MGDLGVEQADDVTPRTKIAPLFFHAGVACQFGHQMRRNEVANLPQERELAGGWLDCGFLFHAATGPLRSGTSALERARPR